MEEYNESENKEMQNDEMLWRNKQPQTFKDIVVKQINKATEELSKDLRKGGTYMVQTPKGIVPMYFPDQREIIIFSVQTLYDLLFPYFDEEANEKIGSIKELIKGSHDKFLQIYIQKEWLTPLREYAQKTGYISRDVQNPKDRPRSTISEEIDEEKTYYLVKIHRDMFRELILLYRRQKELSGKRVARN